jgi:hypothetical protein
MRGNHAFTLLETLVMMAALFVVAMLVAGILKVQWPKISGGESAAVETALQVQP